MNDLTLPATASPLSEKFSDPDVTAKGEDRAKVPFDQLKTLWINTGTLCNIECEHCYILSSPKNDALVYLRLDEFTPFLDEIETLGLGTREIAFTGGEPFMNPDMIAMTEAALARGFHVLILTNAMAPLMRKRVQDGLLALNASYPNKMMLRVSLDHYTARFHDLERGAGSFEKSLEGLDWLQANTIPFAIAGRSIWGEDEATARAGFKGLFQEKGWSLDVDDPEQLVIFPEMDEQADVPEITTKCWDILGLAPSSLMCATSRMVVKRKGEDTPKVLPCTLLPYNAEFEMGATLHDSLHIDGGMFDKGAVKLCHVHCAKFCVLGGGSCSG